MTSDKDLVVALRQASQHLIDQRNARDRDTLIAQLVASAVSLVPAAIGGGISRTEERNVKTSHDTDDAVAGLDRLQSELHEGPCIDAAEDPPEDGVLLARDLDGDDARRWPRFAPRAVEAGYRSMLSVALIRQARGSRSALNLYSDKPDAFDDNAVVTAGLFASHAGAMLFGADQAAHLEAALASRDVIGQAKGILMERFTVDNAEAFEMLVKSSQDTNMKLVDVARWLTSEAEERRAGERS